MGPGHRGLHFTLLPLRDHGDKRKIKNNLENCLKKKSSFNPLFGYFSPSGLDKNWIIMLEKSTKFGPNRTELNLFQAIFRFNIPNSFKNHIKIIPNLC